jgi:hypothetical protein
MDLTTCPECGHLAEVQWRDVLDSTDGPVEHARIRCVQRHWFFLPVPCLDQSGVVLPRSILHEGVTRMLDRRK